MSVALHTQSPIEEELGRLMRDRAKREIDRIDDLEEVARRLGSTRTGIEILLATPKWDIATGFRVLDGLDLLPSHEYDRFVTSLNGHA